jgi:hypothetical protein
MHVVYTSTTVEGAGGMLPNASILQKACRKTHTVVSGAAVAAAIILLTFVDTAG